MNDRLIALGHAGGQGVGEAVEQAVDGFAWAVVVDVAAKAVLIQGGGQEDGRVAGPHAGDEVFEGFTQQHFEVQLVFDERGELAAGAVFLDLAGQLLISGDQIVAEHVDLLGDLVAGLVELAAQAVQAGDAGKMGFLAELALQRRIQAAGQLGGAHAVEHEVVGAGTQGGAGGVEVFVGRKHDGSGRTGEAGDLAGEVDAAAVGQVKAHQRGVDVEIGQNLVGFGDALGKHDLDGAPRAGARVEGPLVGAARLDQQHAAGRGVGRTRPSGTPGGGFWGGGRVRWLEWIGQQMFLLGVTPNGGPDAGPRLPSGYKGGESTGRSSVAVVPCSGSDSMRSTPPWAWAHRRT